MPGTTVDIKTIAEAGVVGAGGAGFPTHVKLSGRADTVLVNAAECEPLLHKDKEVLHAYGTTVLDGLQAAMRLVGASAGWIGIKDNGVTLAQCVAAAGGPTIASASYMVGGVMMGHLEDDHQALVDKTTGGVVVLPDDHVVVRRRRQDWHQIARIGRSACDQCSFCTELCPRWLLGHPIEPHKAMRSLGFNLVGEANVIGTACCCECNLCSLYACPEDLDPRSVCVQNKRRLASVQRRWENPPFNPRRPQLHMDNRKAPMPRLMQKLGLTDFRNVGPLNPRLLDTRKVGIRLKQHIGEPCQPTVHPGQRVAKDQVVGRPPMHDGRPALGVPVHASIEGTVTALGNGVIWLQQTS